MKGGGRGVQDQTHQERQGVEAQNLASQFSEQGASEAGGESRSPQEEEKVVCANCGTEAEAWQGMCPACLCAPGEFECPFWMDEDVWLQGKASGWAPVDKSKTKKRREQEYREKEALEAWQPKPTKNNTSKT